MENLTILNLEGIDFSHLGNFDAITSTPPFGEAFESLHLIECRFSAEYQVPLLISRCSRLRSLRLYALFYETASDPQLESPWSLRYTLPTGLEDLMLAHDRALGSDLLAWLCPSIGATRIRLLDLSMISQGTASAAAQFIRRAGPSVTSLGLGFQDSSWDTTDAQDAFCAVADLSTLTSLEVLELTPLSFHFIRQDRHLSSKHIPLVLEKVRSPKIRTVRLRVSILEAEDLLMGLDRLVRSLNGDNYHDLEQVVFPYIRNKVVAQARKFLEENLGARLRRTVKVVCEGLHS
ncbi:hypothetical protein AURDEDRAFT_174960 [Auricularia subglabra TFB-10046 SS5]|uniref:F-box domain-containing protein n=1 Tax=Auricularia subglabra (strain TFB-10046 / SS5) TaxID=717982 RepID=J0CXY7_AURST|nr:hypothetical protein AURDEDRAFT_174960 [Auricularia subglabra TFB-10046 SS5]